MFQILPTKSPSPDGFTASFFQDHWEVVGGDVINMVQAFHQSGRLLQKFNHTHIVLILKVKVPRRMTELRPISLCNVVYKIIAKVLTRRLKLVMDKVISHNQSTFISGRLIHDNILVVLEILHSLKQGVEGEEGRTAIKLVMAKVYDRVEWGYLIEVMGNLGFHPRFCEWIRECISTVSYSVMKRFRLLFEGKVEGQLCGANETEAEEVIKVLEEYGKVSSQIINLGKSSIYFGKGCPKKVKKRIVLRMNIQARDGFGKYLGIQANFGHSKKAVFEYVQRGIESCIDGWAEQFLSLARNEILIKIVAMATESCYGVLQITSGNLKHWKIEEVAKLVVPEDLELIQTIPISRSGCPDKRIWHYTKNGRYSVRSGYPVVMEMMNNGEFCRKGGGMPSPLGVKGGTWKCIWALMVPNKIRFFIWKACCKALAVLHNLERRRIHVVNKCELCGTPNETETHIFFGCEFSRVFWFGTSLQLNMMDMRARDFLEGWQMVVGRMELEKDADLLLQQQQIEEFREAIGVDREEQQWQNGAQVEGGRVEEGGIGWVLRDFAGIPKLARGLGREQYAAAILAETEAI
ncbi:uncharacterized protein [Malus domestica]|uniref:uncharacterized protein n=1 Tax=Malus domestica TaxID=3750 RepID=UPI0039756D89